ncbi:hypothetical protein [Sabulicella glaciei]|uniref:Uncharacterized protein n=1 Tax=Sabulicella glaciei TaxID=2984948 RepID=A0ABT3P200_9PROT|nr:hypothetical protein [Roseococcus sp. MDT2-1-1]MCW8088440.1 hypothetical protein [Roseococcus sp. MDT2-1-1]
MRVGFGTDVAPHNLIEEMRTALILARNAARDLAAATTKGIFHAAMVGGAEALGPNDLAGYRSGQRRASCWLICTAR